MTRAGHSRRRRHTRGQPDELSIAPKGRAKDCQRPISAQGRTVGTLSLTVRIADRPCGPPLLTQDRHLDEICVAVPGPECLTRTSLLDEAASHVAAEGSRVVLVSRQSDPARAKRVEPVVQQQADNFPSVTAGPVVPVADQNPELKIAMRMTQTRK